MKSDEYTWLSHASDWARGVLKSYEHAAGQGSESPGSLDGDSSAQRYTPVADCPAPAAPLYEHAAGQVSPMVTRGDSGQNPEADSPPRKVESATRDQQEVLNPASAAPLYCDWARGVLKSYATVQAKPSSEDSALRGICSESSGPAAVAPNAAWLSLEPPFIPSSILKCNNPQFSPRSMRGRIGGYARALALSPERRSEIAKKAAAARWGAPLYCEGCGRANPSAKERIPDHPMCSECAAQFEAGRQEPEDHGESFGERYARRVRGPL